MQHHKYSLVELENMMPWEREVYVAMLSAWIQDENEKIKQRNLQRRQNKGNDMAGKQLEAGSIIEDADLDGDGIVTNEELEKHERMLRIENEDKKEDAQRNMAWFALAGMLLYPFAVVIAIGFGLDKAGDILGDMAATYFVSVAAIIAAFYGKEAYTKGK